MLLKQIHHHGNLPFFIEFTNVAEEDYHYHKEMEIMFILRGRANCKIYHWNYSLQAGDILIADTEDLHRVYDSSEDILMLTMYIDLESFTETYPNVDYIIFAPEDCTQRSAEKHRALKNKTAHLKSHLAKIMSAFLNNKDDSSLLMEEINEFLLLLVNQFQGFFVEDMQFKLGNDNASETDQERMLRIIKYIYLNYDKKISLTDLAAQEYLNTYYISHLIKKITGLSFQNFLNYIRVEYAEKLLVEGKLSLTRISGFCGFSSPAYFNKCFQVWHNMTPAQYRRKLYPCKLRYGAEFTGDEAMELLRPYLDSYRPFQKNNAITKAPHLIYIPIDYLSAGGRNFKRSFPLRVLLNTVEDIFRVSLYEKELIALKPSTVYIGPAVRESVVSRRTVLDILHMFPKHGCKVEFASENLFLPAQNVHTAAEAFAHILHKKNPCLSVFGGQDSLITDNGFFTPWYYLHEVFSKIEGNITGQGKQYVNIRGKDTFWLLVFQEDNSFRLKAHIHIDGTSERGVILETRFHAENSCYASLNQSGELPFMGKDFKEHINQVSSGTRSIRSLHPEELPALYINIEPGTFACCQIYLERRDLERREFDKI